MDLRWYYSWCMLIFGRRTNMRLTSGAGTIIVEMSGDGAILTAKGLVHHFEMRFTGQIHANTQISIRFVRVIVFSEIFPSSSVFPKLCANLRRILLRICQNNPETQIVEPQVNMGLDREIVLADSEYTL